MQEPEHLQKPFNEAIQHNQALVSEMEEQQSKIDKLHSLLEQTQEELRDQETAAGEGSAV